MRLNFVVNVILPRLLRGDSINPLGGGLRGCAIGSTWCPGGTHSVSECQTLTLNGSLRAKAAAEQKKSSVSSAMEDAQTGEKFQYWLFDQAHRGTWYLTRKKLEAIDLGTESHCTSTAYE